MDDKADDTVACATRARDALIEWLAQPGRSQRRLSKLLGCYPQSISFWVRGVNRPDYGNMLALEIICGIAPPDWLTDEERRHLALMLSERHKAKLLRVAGIDD